MSKIIVVLGMGRSGTALMCQILECMGVYFGEPNELLGASPINAKGHYEHIPITDIQTQLLQNQFGVTWLFLGELPENWHKNKIVRVLYGNALMKVLESCVYRARLKNMPFGFKDARTTRLLPMWQEIFQELALEPIYLHCIRHPEEVYHSLKPGPDLVPNKDALPMHFEQVGIPSLPRVNAYSIWAAYNMAAEELADKKRTFLFDDWFRKSTAMPQMDKLAEFTGLKPLTADELKEIIDPEIRHWRFEPNG